MYSDNRTALEQRRVCPRNAQYQTCLDLYQKHQLSCSFWGPVTSLPDELLANVGKKLGYHDMYELKNHFHRIELDALNEYNRKGGNPLPHQEMTRLIKSFRVDEWIYFDSEFNTCLFDALDTHDTPLNYFEYYYGDYHQDFIPAKMKEASRIYHVAFMDKRRFMFWLIKEGKEFYQSLPKVERGRLHGDLALLSNWGHFDHLGPIPNKPHGDNP